MKFNTFLATFLMLFLCMSGYAQQLSHQKKAAHQKSKFFTYQDSIQNAIDQNKLHLDSLFTQNKNHPSFKKITASGELFIGDLFSNQQKYAVIVYQTTDSTLRAQVLKENNQHWDTIIQYKSSSYFSEYMPGYELIDTSDFNGDHLPDLRIIHSFWETHSGDQGALWIFNQGKFEYIEGFDQVVSPVYDNKTNRIYSYQSDGCGDMNMVFEEYEIRNNKIISTGPIYCECCECKDGFCQLTKNNRTVLVPLNQVHLAVPAFFSEMVQWKISFCDQ